MVKGWQPFFRTRVNMGALVSKVLVGGAPYTILGPTFGQFGV